MRKILSIVVDIFLVIPSYLFVVNDSYRNDPSRFNVELDDDHHTNVSESKVKLKGFNTMDKSI